MRWRHLYRPWIFVFFRIVMTFGEVSQLDRNNETSKSATLSVVNTNFFPTSKPSPFLAPVMTETCGESFTKFAFVPFLAKENHEIGRLVDFDGGPGWSPFVIVSGNEKALFKVDNEGTIRVAFPFFDTDSDEYQLRLASVNGNLICTVQINIKVAANASTISSFSSNQTFENNVPIRTESTIPFVFPTGLPPALTTRQPTVVVATTTAATVAITTAPVISHVAPMANIFSSNNNRDLAADAPVDLEQKNGTKRQGSFGVPNPGSATIGTYPFGPRCTDPFLTVAVPSDTPPNTPITKVTATHQIGMPITYSIPDVVFDRFRVDPLTGQVFTGPEQLSARTRPFADGRVYPQTRSALEFRVRAVIPGGTYCETVIRVNVVPSTGQVVPPPILPGLRAPPVFVSPLIEFSVFSCFPNAPFGQVMAVDPQSSSRIQYILDNPSSEVVIDLISGELRVGSSPVTVPHSRQIIVRAINVDGLSSTQAITVNFQCQQIFPPGSGGAGGFLQFSRPSYRYLLTNCNSGTQVNLNDRLTLIGNPGMITFTLSNPQEFSIDPSGVIWLRVAFAPGANFQKEFGVFATDVQGQRAQAPVTIDVHCGNPGLPPPPIEPFAFRPSDNPGFNPSFPSFGPSTGPFGPARPIDGPPFPGAFGQGSPPFNPQPNPGFNPGFPSFDPNNGPLSPARPINNPPPFMAISGPNINFANPGFGAVPDAFFRPQFPSRLLRPMHQIQEGFPNIDSENPMNQFGFALGNPTSRDIQSQSSSFSPSEFHSDEASRKTTTLENSDSSSSDSKQRDSTGNSAEDPNQRENKPNSAKKQLQTGSFGSPFFDPALSNPFPGNFRPGMNFDNLIQNPSALGPPFPINSANPFPVNTPPQLPPLPNSLLPPGGSRLPPPTGFFPPGNLFSPMQNLPNFSPPPFSGLNQIMPFSNFIPNPNIPFDSRMNPNELTMRLPQSIGQSPPIFVTPFCAPPGTNYIGRVKALVSDPNERVTYFIWSTGATDIFDLNPITGELRSRVSLGQGTYNVDVAARDSASRTAIMRLEIAITPSCAQPTLGVTSNPFFSLDIVTQGATFSPPSGLGPRFLQPSFTFTIPAAAPPRTLIGQVQALSGSGEPLRYFLSPPGEFEIDFQGRIFNRGFVQVPRTVLVTAVDSRERAATANVLIVGASRTGFGIPNCANDQVPESAARSTSANILPTINHFGTVRQLSKSGLTIGGPTLITVDAPYIGVLPVTLASGTILGDYNVTGGSGTYRWLNKDDSLFEMTGEAAGSLITKSSLQPGSYEHFAAVKDNAGHTTNMTIKIIVRQPDFTDNLSHASLIEPFLNRSPQEMDAVF